MKAARRKGAVQRAKQAAAVQEGKQTLESVTEGEIDEAFSQITQSRKTLRPPTKINLSRP